MMALHTILSILIKKCPGLPLYVHINMLCNAFMDKFIFYFRDNLIYCVKGRRSCTKQNFLLVGPQLLPPLLVVSPQLLWAGKTRIGITWQYYEILDIVWLQIFIVENYNHMIIVKLYLQNFSWCQLIILVLGTIWVCHQIGEFVQVLSVKSVYSSNVCPAFINCCNIWQLQCTAFHPI